MTLALLLTAVTGAWAISDPNSVYWTNETWAGWAESITTHTVGDITITCSGNAKAYQSTSSNNPLALQAGANDAITFTSNGKPFASVAIMTDDELNVAGWTYNSSKWSYEWSGEPTTSVTLSGCNINADVIIFTFGTAEAPLTVAWTASTKTGTFLMPGSDVVLTPIYAKAAAFATTGTEPEVKTLLPEAAEGVIAGTDASLIAEGTGIVAFAGTSAEAKQGTLMYAIGTSATQAPDAFSATVPTAKDIADEGAEVLVWYYIKGADTPEGQTATAENTFNDSEICETPIKVTLLSNKFDITFKAANANTIEAGKATVTVGGTAATVTEGKLEGVKMGSEVKMTAKEGYKFRKVELQGWQRKGLGTITDGLFMSLFSRPDITVHCNVYENVNTPGLYKIDGFQCALVAAFYGISEEEMRQYEGGNWRNVKILIDATNPEKVSISDQDYGIQVNSHYGFIRIQSEATGKLVDNVITFPSNEMYVGFTGLGDWYYGNVNGTFKIMLPK